MTARAEDIADLPNWPRLLSEEQAAAYVGVSPTTFRTMVEDGDMPECIQWGRRKLWDRRVIDLKVDSVSGLVIDQATGGVNDRERRKQAHKARRH